MWIANRKCLALVVVSCIVVRLLAMTALQSWNLGPRYGYRDGEIGAAIAAGDGFSWPRESHYHDTNGEPELTAWQAPVYPYVIAAAFHLLGTYSRSSAIALYVFQIVLSALTCIFIFQLGRKLFNENTGLLAGLMFAFYPSAVHFAVRPTPTPRPVCRRRPGRRLRAPSQPRPAPPPQPRFRIPQQPSRPQRFHHLQPRQLQARLPR